jgi:hypothetical protein
LFLEEQARKEQLEARKTQEELAAALEKVELEQKTATSTGMA